MELPGYDYFYHGRHFVLCFLHDERANTETRQQTERWVQDRVPDDAHVISEGWERLNDYGTSYCVVYELATPVAPREARTLFRGTDAEYRDKA